MEETPVNKFTANINRVFITILVGSVILGTTTGYILAQSTNTTPASPAPNGKSETPKTASQDKRTFRDFADGTIQKKATPKNPNQYSEGTHVLVRDGAVPVALTSSVVDLAQYEGKKVKVYGETQKAIKEGWLMDVGLVEEK